MLFRKHQGQDSDRRSQPIWAILRRDDAGNYFTVEQNLTHTAAEEMVRKFEEAGHKHFYWIVPQDGAEAGPAASNQ